MDITEYMGAGLIFTDLSATGKEEAFGAMVDQIVAHGVVSPEKKNSLLEKLRERELLANTFAGNGAAIPHAFAGFMDRVMIAVGRFEEGVEYGGATTEPVLITKCFAVSGRPLLNSMVCGSRNFAVARMKVNRPSLSCLAR